MPHPVAIEAVLAALADGQTLDGPTAELVFAGLLRGEPGPEQSAALLAMLQVRGVTPDELTGAARAMRAAVEPVPYRPPPGTVVVDTCGTGGAPKTFNVSTAAAFVVAGARPEPGSGVGRVVVAKHGNRSRTGRGSAEVLSALGVNLDAPPEVQAASLDRVGVCFCFAMHHHPAMRHAAPVRRSLGFSTIFNLLGPLTNPAGAGRQLIGVYRPSFVPLVAETLRRLGAEHAMVVHSDDGLDELTVTAPVMAAVVRDGRVRTERIEPLEFGLARAPIEAVRARDPAHAVEIVRDVLDGRPGPAADMVILTAAAALVVAGAAESLGAAIGPARESIASGRAAGALAGLSRVTHAGG